MKTCPNPACGFLRRHGHAAEYQDAAATCSDCGGALVGATAAKMAESDAPGQTQAASWPWMKLLVTLGGAVASQALLFVEVPGVGIRAEYGHPSALFPTLGLFSVVALGLAPMVSAWALVELAALAVPAWRSLRIGGPQDRAALRRVAIPLAALLAFVQSVSMARYLAEHLSAMSYSGIGGGSSGGGAWQRWAVVVLLPLGTLALALIAAAIDRWGMGDGISVVLVAAVVFKLPDAFLSAYPASRTDEVGSPYKFVLLIAVGVVALTWRMLGRAAPFQVAPRPFALQLPTSGIDPIGFSASALLFPVTIASLLGLPRPSFLDGALVYGALQLGLVASLTVALSLLYNLPSRVAGLWLGPEASEAARGEIRSQLAHSTLHTGVLVVGLVLVAFVSTQMIPGLALGAGGLASLVILTAVARDFWKEWQFRGDHADLVGVWPIHRLYAVGPALKALLDAGIPAFPRGLHHRSLLQFFGPYVPVTLLVPREHAERAAAITRQRLVGGETPPPAS